MLYFYTFFTLEVRAISMDYLLRCRGFQWDEGNTDKNWIKYKVSRAEAEQMFFNRPLVARAGEQRSEHGLRYYALGRQILVANFLSFLPSVRI